MPMQVFISWSGPRSGAYAELLNTWIKDVIQAAQPWISKYDIEKGALWFEVIYRELLASSYGVVCVTATNQHSPWLLFETGALGVKMEKINVCPICIDLSKDQVSPPMSFFNLAQANDKSEMLKLIRSINNAVPKEAQIEKGSLERSFDRWWPDYESGLAEVMAVQTDAAEPPPRPLPEMVKEVLDLTRSHSDTLARLEGNFRGVAVEVRPGMSFANAAGGIGGVSPPDWVAINRREPRNRLYYQTAEVVGPPFEAVPRFQEQAGPAGPAAPAPKLEGEKDKPE
jgi:hypothetical protein